MACTLRDWRKIAECRCYYNHVALSRITCRQPLRSWVSCNPCCSIGQDVGCPPATGANERASDERHAKPVASDEKADQAYNKWYQPGKHKDAYQEQDGDPVMLWRGRRFSRSPQGARNNLCIHQPSIERLKLRWRRLAALAAKLSGRRPAPGPLSDLRRDQTSGGHYRKGMPKLHIGTNHGLLRQL